MPRWKTRFPDLNYWWVLYFSIPMWLIQVELIECQQFLKFVWIYTSAVLESSVFFCLSSLSDTLCPAGQFYEDCGNRVDSPSASKGLACEQTCETYLLNLTCSTHEPCVPGCVCPAGWVGSMLSSFSMSLITFKKHNVVDHICATINQVEVQMLSVVYISISRFVFSNALFINVFAHFLVLSLFGWESNRKWHNFVLNPLIFKT